jgi:sigma-54 dependent transcriptional regulator, acetoin dehydrogenase operon transcriptional activator AcoR
MRTILFVNQGIPDKPAMAAAVLCELAGKVTSTAVAAEAKYAGNVECREVMEAADLPWPSTILAIDEFCPFEYDLVVTFCERGEQVYPALPGNPVLVNWHVSDGTDKDGWEAVLQRIRSLVDDLLHQGYLDALVQARRNGELILDNLSEGIIAHGFNRKFFFFNRAAEKITGISREDVLGRDCHDIFPEKFCASHCAFCDGALTPLFPTAPYQITIRNVDGEDKLVEMFVVPLRDSKGTPTGVVASMRDISREHELAKRLGEINQFAGIVGQDARMQDVFQTITELADSDVPVLVHGESGTGKELVAAAIHNEGSRADKRFVTINCGALPDSLLESELFGHVKGAFTGAVRDKKGRFELADGGTLFLDEIGDITQAMQVKLLRFLQDGSFQRLGAEDAEKKVNVRIIAATHVDLRAAIEKGRFREDLFYRLCVVPVTLPPLRKRLGDIPLLANHFLKQAADVENRPDVSLSQETVSKLMEYDWPGNVRELQNVIRYLLVKCPHDTIEQNYLPPEFSTKQISTVQSGSVKKRRKKLDAERVRNALVQTGGNKAEAARVLSVGRATLYRFLSVSGL